MHSLICPRGSQVVFVSFSLCLSGRYICEATPTPKSNKDLEVPTRRHFKLWFIDYNEYSLNCLSLCDICGAPAPASIFFSGVDKCNYAKIGKDWAAQPSVNKSANVLFSVSCCLKTSIGKMNGLAYRVAEPRPCKKGARRQINDISHVIHAACLTEGVFRQSSLQLSQRSYIVRLIPTLGDHVLRVLTCLICKICQRVFMLHSHKPADPEGLVKDLLRHRKSGTEASLLVHEF